jgi:hypothetical protein
MFEEERRGLHTPNFDSQMVVFVRAVMGTHLKN